MKKFISQATDTFRELCLYYSVIILVSGLLFSFFEHRKLVDSIWWSFVTAMTVGYGDIYPTTLGGRTVAVLLMHIVPLVIVPLIIVRMMNQLIEDKNQFTHVEQQDLQKGIESIQKHLGIKDDFIP